MELQSLSEPSARGTARARRAPAGPALSARAAGVAVADLRRRPGPGSGATRDVQVRRRRAPIRAPPGAGRPRHAAPAQQGRQPAARRRDAGRPHPAARSTPLLLAPGRQAHGTARLPRGPGPERRPADGRVRRRAVPADQPDPLDDAPHGPHRRRTMAAQLRRVPGQRPHSALRERVDLLLPVPRPPDREPDDDVVPARPARRRDRPGRRDGPRTTHRGRPTRSTRRPISSPTTGPVSTTAATCSDAACSTSTVRWSTTSSSLTTTRGCATTRCCRPHDPPRHGPGVAAPPGHGRRPCRGAPRRPS